MVGEQEMASESLRPFRTNGSLVIAVCSLKQKKRFQQYASEFWSSTEEVHRKIQLPSIEVVRFF